jgi:hypothetical protein
MQIQRAEKNISEYETEKAVVIKISTANLMKEVIAHKNIIEHERKIDKLLLKIVVEVSLKVLLTLSLHDIWFELT